MIQIEEARKVLGKTGKKMKDEEIIKLQKELYILSNILLDHYFESRTNGKLDNK